MDTLPSLDAHAHIDPCRAGSELTETGAVLAMTFALDGGAAALKRTEPHIAWGMGCHPRFIRAEEAFDVQTFRALAEKTAIVGEIGLDSGSRVPLATQLRTLRQVLAVVSTLPRIVSIHSYQATGPLLKELRQCPISVPILHWWTGSAAETSEAVELGCYFSIHSAVARQSKFRTRVPPERILVESDHGHADPPAAIPLRVGWVEYLVAQQYGIDVKALRRLVWQNFGTIVQKTGTLSLLPELFTSTLASVA